MKNVKLYLLFSFSIAWLVCLAIRLTGGLAGGRVFLLSLCMLAPALAVLLTKLITREGWQDMGFKPRLRKHVGWYLLAWFGPSLLILLGVALYFLLYPGQFDPVHSAALAAANAQLAKQGIEASPALLTGAIIGQVLGAMLLAPLLNIIFCTGEELGWRGYLLPRLLKKYGLKTTLLLMGLIWGLWHAPMIAMGHNYGLGYAGWPWTGILAMILLCFFIGCFFALVALKTDSFWPASLAHGAMNGLAAIGLMFLSADSAPNPFIGPSATGVIGGAGLLVAGLLCFFLMKKPDPAVAGAPAQPGAAEFFQQQP